MKSFVAVPNIFKFYLIFILVLALISCSESNAQREFENQAFSQPSGITEMTSTGGPVDNGENDPDDWRIAPDFQGSISIETPAYPNPVSFSDEIEILASVNSFGAVNGLQVYAFQQPTQPRGPLVIIDGQLETGFKTIHIDPETFASSTGTGNFGNLYRIIIYDGSGNVISYGDVQVQ